MQCYYPSISEKTAACKSFVKICEELESLHESVLTSIITKQAENLLLYKDLRAVHGDDDGVELLKKCITDSYHEICKEVLDDDLNWGRIAAVVVYTTRFAKKALEEDETNVARILVEKCLNFVEDYTAEWIVKMQNGWEKNLQEFVKRSDRKMTTTISLMRSLIFLAANIFFQPV